MPHRDRVRFRKDGEQWVPEDGHCFLLWQQGVFVTHITNEHVALGTLWEPVGIQPRDAIVNQWLNEHVEWVHA